MTNPKDLTATLLEVRQACDVLLNFARRGDPSHTYVDDPLMERFLRQHAGVTTADGLMLYDNSDEDSPGCAWAIQTQEERDEQERDDRTRRADHPHRRP